METYLIIVVLSIVVGMAIMYLIRTRGKKQKKQVVDPYERLFDFIRYRKLPENKVFMNSIKDATLEMIEAKLKDIKRYDQDIEYIKQQMSLSLKTYADGIMARENLVVDRTRELELQLVQQGIDSNKTRIKCLEDDKDRAFKAILSLEEDACSLEIKLAEYEGDDFGENVYPISSKIT